jgi:4-alpha-glucanotransferase
MRLGVVHDLAVGVHPAGADAWSLRDTLVRGVTVGAPPDQFNQLGQDWSQPPWHPVRLAEAGYAPYRDLVRAILADAGGLRIDHVIGLFRLWWVPEGRTAAEGAYVRYDHEAMLSILVLEAHRAGAFVVGEDLGVVEPQAREVLLERGILGTSVLWFEWDGENPLPPERYRELCLATVTTHDLAPSRGYLELAHVDLRERLDLLTRPVAEERAQELATIDRVRRLLVERDLLDPDGDDEDVVVALHRFLAATPSRLRGVALSDLVGDRRIINQPGTNREYPNWRLPLAGPDERPVLLEDLPGLPLARRIADAL